MFCEAHFKELSFSPLDFQIIIQASQKLLFTLSILPIVILIILHARFDNFGVTECSFSV